MRARIHDWMGQFFFFLSYSAFYFNKKCILHAGWECCNNFLGLICLNNTSRVIICVLKNYLTGRLRIEIPNNTQKYCIDYNFFFPLIIFFHFSFFAFLILKFFFIKWLRLKVNYLIFNFKYSISIACNTNYMGSQSAKLGFFITKEIRHASYDPTNP